ncbi:MAG: hypothetical protein IPK16_22405 [Anaerolineales bacterium]|nr:hypothetical protein [Anaerolineales bacterium]
MSTLAFNVRRLLALTRLLLLYLLLCAILLAGGLLRRTDTEAGADMLDAQSAVAPMADQAPFLGVTVELSGLQPAARDTTLVDLKSAGFWLGPPAHQLGRCRTAARRVDWGATDELLNAIVKADLIPVVVLDGSPSWARAR